MSDPIERVLRTPDSAFVNISGWDWGSPHYFTSTLFGASIRIAYWDLGPRESPTVPALLVAVVARHTAAGAAHSWRACLELSEPPASEAAAVRRLSSRVV